LQAEHRPRVLKSATWTVLDVNTGDWVHERSSPDPADSSARLLSAWDDEGLLFGVAIYDDVQVSDSREVWRDDSVELGIDGLNDKVGWRADDHQFTFTVDGRITDYGRPAPGVMAAVAPLNGGWGLEVMIPVDVLGAGPLVEGKVIGFTFGLHDDDDGGDWDSYMIWEGDSTNDSADYGTLLLVSPVITPTLTPTATGIPIATLTPTSTRTVTPTWSPTPEATATGTATVSVTPTVTATRPRVIWQCDCREVTVTPEK